MKKPANYKYYSSKKNGVPFKDWPQECKDYKYWKRDIFRHPEWKELSDEEYLLAKKESKRQRGINATKLMRNRYQDMSTEQKSEVNKKKGSHYNNMMDEEKKKQNEILRQRSQNFWDSMTDDQRKEFCQYRWNLKSYEEKEVVIHRFNQAGIDRMKNLPREEIYQHIERMNEERIKKLEEDAEFREQQFELLRKHCQEYFDSLSGEELNTHYKNMHDKWRSKWQNDQEFRNNITTRLRESYTNYLDSLTPEQKSSLLSNNKFTRKFEKQFSESVLSNNYIYEKEYKVQNSNGFKLWDYAIYDKADMQLVMLVDLDGEFYHADKCDYNGLHSREDRDEKRGYFVPDGVKIQIIEENRFVNGFKEMMRILISNYDQYVNNLFELYRSIEFPYPNYGHLDLMKSFKQLLSLDCENKYLSLSTRNREGDRLINHFHHSIYHAHNKDSVSPYDAWNDDDLLRKCIINRTLYRSTLDPNKILQGFNVSKIAPKVSVFSAGRAKLLIYKYLNKFNEIFDPFSGFSGRMLGTMSMNKHYIGQDISPIHISESKNIIDFIKRCKINFPNIIIPNILCKDVNDSYGEYECLFTCPPYGMKEIWKREICSDKSCDDWIDICLSHFKCKRYLFIVDNTDRYSDFIVDLIINRSHFGKNVEYVLLMNRED